MSDRAVLIVSFGTSYPDARAAITSAEQAVSDALPGYAPYTAFTSSIIRGILAKRNAPVFSVEEAMDAVIASGARSLVVQPTHLLYGDEYDKLRAAVLGKAPDALSVTFGAPLLGNYEDMRIVLSALSRSLPREQGEALVLMGHGTPHFSNTVYAALDYLAKSMGLDDLFVGTVETWPDLDEVLAHVKKAGWKKAVLTPLMLVAGDHAQNDMDGDGPDSWKSRFSAAGVEARCAVVGLGAYPEVLELYCRHAQEAAHGI